MQTVLLVNSVRMVCAHLTQVTVILHSFLYFSTTAGMFINMNVSLVKLMVVNF